MMPYQTFHNINLHSFLQQNCQPKATQLTIIHCVSAVLQQINTPGSKYCDKTGLTLGMNVTAQPHI